MESPIALLTLAACLVAAVLLFYGIKAARSHLAALREIDAGESAEPDTTSVKPNATSTKSSTPAIRSDVATALVSANNIIVVPGYGMAVAQAHLKIWELAKILRNEGVNVSFAIHPAAGRMPGHMNVLLDEADVPHDIIYDLESINAQFPTCDLVLVVGANDIVNPAANTDTDSPVFGMPILEAGQARQVFVIKRDQGTGFSGIENTLFSADNTRMFYGDAQDILKNLVAEIAAY